MLGNYVNRRLHVTDEDHKQGLADLLKQVTMRQISTETCITVILEVGAWAKFPMRDKLKEIGVPICFLYGDQDWMTRGVADEVMERGDLKDGSHIGTIDTAGHHLYIDNSHGCVHDVVKFAFGTEASEKFKQDYPFKIEINENIRHVGRRPEEETKAE